MAMAPVVAVTEVAIGAAVDVVEAAVAIEVVAVFEMLLLHADNAIPPRAR
jgi:hypothetical protein